MENALENNLTRQKFEIFMMLCAAGIDGTINMSELEKILERWDHKDYEEVFEVFRKMSSPNWLSFFKAHKDEFLPTEEDRDNFLHEIYDVLSVGDKMEVKESNFYKVLKMLCNDEL